MNQYLMLREGKETGPFSLEELQRCNLQPLDLIWIVGKSIGWKYPDEIEELRPFAAQNKSYSFLEENNSVQEDALQTGDRTATTGKRSRVRLISNVSLAVLLIAGAIATAVFITKDWANRAGESRTTKKQVAVKDGFIIPEDAAASISNDFRNAITKEYVPAEDSLKAKKAIPKNLKKLVSIESNDYKVGVLGGVNKLKLTISNNSEVLMDEVTIQINYLKRNGEVVHKEIVSEKNIKPQSSKIIDIAPSKRGVKVNCKVIAVETEDTKDVAMNEV